VVDDGIDRGHRFGSEVAPTVLPLVVLLGVDHPDEADDRGPVAEDPDDRGAALDLLVQPLEWVRAPDLAAVGLGEREVGEQVGLGVGEQVRPRGALPRRPSVTRSSCVRSAVPSGCSMTDRMAEATTIRAQCGTRSWALRVRWTRHRWHEAPRSCHRFAATSAQSRAGLGFEVEGLDARLSALDPANFARMLERVVAAYPNLLVVASTLRNARSASRNDWSAICWSVGAFYRG